MEKAKKIFSRVMSVIAALLFIFGLLIFISVISATGGKTPSFLGYSIMQIKTGSMEPTYMTGCVIVVKKTDTDTLKQGDVISFYSSNYEIDGMVNTHRIAKVTDFKGSKMFVTKGDANLQEDDDLVLPARVIGKVKYNLGTFSGSVISILRNPKIIFFLIVLPLIFITFGEAINLVTMIVENREAKKIQKDDEDGESGN